MKIRAQGWGEGGEGTNLTAEKLAGDSVTQRKAGEPSSSCGLLSPVLPWNRDAHYVGMGVTWEPFKNSRPLPTQLHKSLPGGGWASRFLNAPQPIPRPGGSSQKALQNP